MHLSLRHYCKKVDGMHKELDNRLSNYKIMQMITCRHRKWVYLDNNRRMCDECFVVEYLGSDEWVNGKRNNV